MDHTEELAALREQNRYYESVIKNMSAPIIPSVVPSTIMVPIAGYIFQERFEIIRTKVLEYADFHRDIERVIFDFTGVRSEDMQTFNYNELVTELGQLNSALKLMGLRPIYVGFNPRFVQEIVHAGIHMEIETYTNFRRALQQLISEQDKTLYSL